MRRSASTTTSSSSAAILCSGSSSCRGIARRVRRRAPAAHPVRGSDRGGARRGPSPISAAWTKIQVRVSGADRAGRSRELLDNLQELSDEQMAALLSRADHQEEPQCRERRPGDRLRSSASEEKRAQLARLLRGARRQAACRSRSPSPSSGSGSSTSSSRAAPPITSAAALRFDRALDPRLFAATLREIVRRHQTLRTTFALRGRPAGAGGLAAGGAGAPSGRPLGPPPERRDAEARRVGWAAPAVPFDLARGPAAARLPVRLARGRVLLVARHAPHRLRRLVARRAGAASWGRSTQAFAAGRPSPLPELPLAVRRLRRLAARAPGGRRAGAAELDCWRERLAGAPAALELPTDRPRPARSRATAARAAPSRSPPSCARRCATLARQRGRDAVHGPAGRLPGAARALHRPGRRLRRHADRRPRPRGARRADRLLRQHAGPARRPVGRADRSRELLARVRARPPSAPTRTRTCRSRSWSRCSSRSATRAARRCSRSMFVLQNTPRAGSSCRTSSSRDAVPRDAGPPSSTSLLEMLETPQRARAASRVQHAICSTPRPSSAWSSRLRAAARRDRRRAGRCRLSALLLLGAAESGTRSSRSGTTPARAVPARALSTELFERQVRRTPRAAAPSPLRGEELTYARARPRGPTGWRSHLRAARASARTAGRAVCLERSLELVVACSACSRRAAPTCRSIPRYPRERLAVMLEDAAPRADHRASAGRRPAGSRRRPGVVELDGALDAGETASARAGARPAAVAPSTWPTSSTPPARPAGPRGSQVHAPRAGQLR